MNKIAFALTALAATALSTAAPAATTIVTHGDPVITLSSGTFTDTVSGKSGSFMDTFDFAAPLGFTLQSASITAANVAGGAKITFGSITLNGINFLADAGGSFHLDDQPLLANNHIIVNGSYFSPNFKKFSSTFTGSLAFSGGVPEPATWALMLLGIGGIGAGMRRRNVSALRFA